jgi:hypothetical protein
MIIIQYIFWLVILLIEGLHELAFVRLPNLFQRKTGCLPQPQLKSNEYTKEDLLFY